MGTRHTCNDWYVDIVAKTEMTMVVNLTTTKRTIVITIMSVLGVRVYFYETPISFSVVAGPNCLDDSQTSPYTGNQNMSQTGKICQSWKATGYTDSHLSGSTVVDAQNFCRQMSGQQPVCRTSAGIENCDVPMCAELLVVTTMGAVSFIGKCRNFIVVIQGLLITLIFIIQC